ncbi:MAG: deoxynucleoside kinase [bacterium]|jgi:deoxyadenosine/deoxycytidine kinase|nr:deoxynucleoside kinase [bacterium]
MVPEQLKSVAVEGVIGVGKTSLCQILAQEWGAQLVLEEPHKNPFLEDFYREPRHFAFQVQLNFLFARYNQLLRHRQMSLFAEITVSDYLFDKDRIFAYLNLDERELVLYEKIIEFMEQEIHRPDLVVYLQSNVERLLKNIQIRNRSYEREMSTDYIRQLNDAYNAFFLNYQRTPLLIVNANEIDFVHNAAHRQALLDRLARPVSGTMYFNPGI